MIRWCVKKGYFIPFNNRRKTTKTCNNNNEKTYNNKKKKQEISQLRMDWGYLLHYKCRIRIEAACGEDISMSLNIIIFTSFST